MSFWKKKPLLPREAQDAVVAAIREAEGKTSGEIRVFVEPHCSYMNALDRATELFAQLGMEQTEARNAVIVYVALADKQFAIYGDEGIHQRVGGNDFWQTEAVVLKTGLSKGDVAGGLVNCILEIGAALATHFPFDPDIERNELPDEIVFGK